ncbi:Hypothetical predicted protein [Octopus vulgaris]|uniref:Uncharacterized protein n=1 Tax=Octopus vulgaris TaxID=6645 RepID=A0AA36B3W2_OCTVU|nr:Hypothetical predicted protein [Octopus vulgaris]
MDTGQNPDGTADILGSLRHVRVEKSCPFPNIHDMDTSFLITVVNKTKSGFVFIHILNKSMSLCNLFGIVQCLFSSRICTERAFECSYYKSK